MRLYKTPSGKWAGTQSDAVKIARESDAGRWQQFEVPTDKAGLLDFLNVHRVGDETAAAPVPDSEVVPTGSTFDTPPAAAPAPLSPVTPDTRRQWDAESITDFLLDRASVAQVEAIFAAIGARFAEARSQP